MKKILDEIKKISKDLGDIKLMEVCGGHTNTIMKYGIRRALPPNIKLLSGPGCPVCVTSQRDIDCAVELARNKIPIVTYGDMLRVPGSNMSLEQARAQGADVHVVYSALEALKYPNCVFFGIGFETTTPMSAYLLSKNIKLYSCHKIMMPAMKAVIQGELKVDGLIDPGHVSTIIGSKIWEELDIPQVVSGFKPEMILSSIKLLLKLIRDTKEAKNNTGNNNGGNNKVGNKVINNYNEVVQEQGNLIAQELINTHFKLTDAEWRGLGVIEKSGLDPVDPALNAKVLFKEIIKDVKPGGNKDCICGSILKGLKQPRNCTLFGVMCTPSKPAGACMVSSEGSCNIAYKYEHS